MDCMDMNPNEGYLEDLYRHETGESFPHPDDEEGQQRLLKELLEQRDKLC